MLENIGTKTIETERLVLRRFEYADADAMLKSEYENPAKAT